jgi:hypothetical protein
MRTVTLHREPPRGWVELVDEAQFASGPGALEAALTTFGDATLDAAGVVTLRGARGALRVEYDADSVTPRVEHIKDVDLAGGAADVRRVVFALTTPAQQGAVRLRIVPV